MNKAEALQRIENIKYLGKLELDILDYPVYHKKYNDFKRNALKRGSIVSLTLQDYMLLCYQANITPDRVGLRNGQYQLGRVGDIGEYKLGNVRFITKEQNMQELYDNGGFARGIAKRMSRIKGENIEQSYQIQQAFG